LKTCYDIRSTILHGAKLTTTPRTDYGSWKNFLGVISKKVLLKYIELGNAGKTREQIIEYIDNLSLGHEQRV